jgi:O-methyltransferase involved in polyketide biosynthesis
MVTTATPNPAALGSVQRTLLLPLWGRAVETKKPHPLLVDPSAVRITDRLDYDFSTIAANISFVSQLAWIARSLHIDQTIRTFLEQHPKTTIVNLGCGLDTTFERVDNGTLYWYDLDLPDVIELRTRYIQPTSRRQFIARSILDDSWMDVLEPANSVLFVAAGVLYYFEESQVRTVLSKLADRFPGSELIFDACSPRGLRIANKRVIEGGGMDATAQLKWGIRRASEILEWDRHFTIVAEYPIFRGLKDKLSLKEKWGTFLSDTLGIMSMIHVRMGAEIRP